MVPILTFTGILDISGIGDEHYNYLVYSAFTSIFRPQFAKVVLLFSVNTHLVSQTVCLIFTKVVACCISAELRVVCR